MKLQRGDIVFINGSGCFLFKILTLSDGGKVSLIERLRDKTTSHIQTSDLTPYWVQPADEIKLGAEFGRITDIKWNGTFDCTSIFIEWGDGRMSSYFDEILREKNIIFIDYGY